MRDLLLPRKDWQHYEGLADCSGGSASDLEAAFPLLVPVQFVSAPDGINTITDFQATLASIYALPENTPVTNMVLDSDISLLKDKPFIIDSISWYGYGDDASMLANWQPNFFDPSFRINDVDIYGNGRKENRSSGVGLELPFCRQFKYAFRPLDRLVVQASLVRRLENGNLRYHALKCEAMFRTTL